MRICVLGAGAVGGALAVRLRLAGFDVEVVARGEHGRAIRENGLTLIAGETRHTVRLPCASDSEAVQPPDLVFVTVKQTQLVPIAGPLRRMMDAGSRIVLAMNGIPWWFARELPLPPAGGVMEAIDPGGILSATLDPAHLVSAVVQSSSEVVAPGVVLTTTPKRHRMILGCVAAGAHDQQSDILGILRRADCDAIGTPDIRAEIWDKMALWVAVSPMAALTGMSLDRLASDDGGFRVMCGVMNDMIALGRRLGFALSADVEGRIGFYRDKPTRPSLLKDVDLGREPELASCLLIFEALATTLGLPAPSLQAVATLARLRFVPQAPAAAEGFPSLAIVSNRQKM